MSTITRKSITDTIEGLEQLTNRGIQSVYIDMAIAGLCSLLASLEAEAVGWRYRFVHTPKSEEHGSPFTTDWVLAHSEDECNPSDCFERQPLFTAPPAPVSMPDENGLLPCPCCGGNAEFDYDDDNLNWISCNVCGISTDAAYHTDVDARDKLREVWNRRAAMLQGDEPVSNRDELRVKVRREHAEWSQATFGDVGPVGPLKHLSKEALEAAAEPGDLSEWADMQFLLWDAQRRAGISDGEITAAMEEKLKVNMARQWPEPKDGEPRLHIKTSGNSPVIPDGWMACSEQMPEDEQEVLTRNKMGHCFVSFFDEHSGLFFERIDVAAACCIEHILVTHWMPLPAAPQQEVN